MTLTQRLLLATGLLAIAAAATVGYSVRDAWRRAEEQRFQNEFRAALEPLAAELTRELERLPELLVPRCEHDSLVDEAVIGLSAGDLPSRRLAISLRVPELSKALEVDALFLVTHRGEILGAHTTGLVGQRRPELPQRLLRLSGRAELALSGEPTLTAACLRRDPQNPKVWVGLLAERRAAPILARIGRAYSMSLTFDGGHHDADSMSERVPLAGLGKDVAITASRSRLPLATVLENLDATILFRGGLTVVAALLAAALLSRGLARPMIELARQASEVMRGEPRHIVASGPREIEESAAAFNRAIDDLAALRRRLVASERIAAWREIARRVAHEIKNPLLPIRAAIETLRRLRARDDPAFDEYFDEATRTALDEVNRINQIVSEFTEFARLPQPKPSDVDLAELVRSVVTLHATGSVPVRFESAACPSVRADRNQIVQVVTNLVKNAIEAVAERADGRVEVELSNAAQGRVRVSVRDNGPGVAPEMRDRLFIPYITTKSHGTGLGLPIAERFVSEHGGEIGYRDVPTGGSEFWFELPLIGPETSTASDDGAPPSARSRAGLMP